MRIPFSIWYWVTIFVVGAVAIAIGSAGLSPWWILGPILLGGIVVCFDFGIEKEVDVDDDPFGRSLKTAKTHEVRGRALFREKIDWVKFVRGEHAVVPSAMIEGTLGVFPEHYVNCNDLHWIVAERDYWGWPDPPRFVVLGFDAAGELQAAADFDFWPEIWCAPSVV